MTVRLPENRLWHRTLKPNIPAQVSAKRIEPRIPPGIPDLYWHGTGGIHLSGWVELKSGVGDVRPLQKNFLRGEVQAGVSAHVVAERYEQLWLLDGLTGIDLHDKILFDDALRHWPMNSIDHDELWYIIRNSPCK